MAPKKSSSAPYSKKRAQNVVEKLTKRAMSRGLNGAPTKKGLGITRNEGPARLQKALDVLGYSGARRVVSQTRSGVSAGKVGNAKKPPSVKRSPSRGRTGANPPTSTKRLPITPPRTKKS